MCRRAFGGFFAGGSAGEEKNGRKNLHFGVKIFAIAYVSTAAMPKMNKKL